MNTAWLLTGSNMGTREDYLSSAKREIALQCGTVQKQSSIYETAAWGKTDQPAFLNQALEIMTPLNARQLIRRLLKIEKQLGRIREEKYGPRLIDIDILMFGDEIHQYDLLKLPHPELPNRRFALLPLAEIAGEVIHPVLQQSVFSLLADCPDTLEVKKIT
jgi:2-amino-4-hydroxy-6-hydroxymethyldihydropteridine diphosphokinase